MNDSTATTSRYERLRLPLLLALYATMTLPACFLGYGSDNDSYQVVGAGKWVWEQHRLVTSRLPGYWAFETVVYVLNRLGGSLLVNLVSFAMGAGILWRLDALRKRLPGAALTLASVCLILVPSFQIAASSCDDYLWSLLALVLALEALLNNEAPKAGLWGALAVAWRPTNVVVLAGMFAGVLLAARYGAQDAGGERSVVQGAGWKRVLLAGAISLGGLLPLVLSYPSFGHSFAFLHETQSDPAVYTWKMYAGRFGYKLMSAFGPLALAALIAGCVALRRRFVAVRRFPKLAFACLGVLVTNLLLFARFPLEISYLLPAMLFGFVLLSFTVLPGRRWLAGSLVSTLVVANLFSVVLAEPNVVDRASAARFTLSVQAGPVFEDVKARRALVGCDSLDCWRKRTGH